MGKRRSADLKALLEKGKTATEDKKTLDLKWSPNNIKTIIISSGMAWIEHFTVEGSSNGKWFEEIKFESTPEESEGSVLDAVFNSSIKYSAIEEIIFLVDKGYTEATLQKDMGTARLQALKQAAEQRKDGIIADEFSSFKRLYAITAVNCTNMQASISDIMLKLREQQSRYRQETARELEHYTKSIFKDYLHLKYTVLMDKGNKYWWRSGISDEKLSKDDKTRVLRPWLYELDTVPADGREMGPIYKGFKRIAKPYLDAIELKKEEAKAEQEAQIKKAELSNRVSSVLTADKQVIAEKANKYIGAFEFIRQAQLLRRDLWREQYKYIAKCEASGNLFAEERLDDAEEKNTLMAAKIAYQVYSSDGRHTDTSLKGFKKFLYSVNPMQMYETSKGISTDLQNIAILLGYGLRDYLTNLLWLDNNGVVKNVKPVVESNKDTSVIINRLNGYYDRLNVGLFPEMPALDGDIKSCASTFLQVVDLILKTEMLILYRAFIKTMPYWVLNSSETALRAELLLHYSGITDNVLLYYNKDTLNMLTNVVKVSEDWQARFVEIPCTAYREGNLYKNVAEYSEHILGTYKALISYLKGLN